MSELTQCNFCHLKDIWIQAREDKKVVSLVPSSSELNGLDVYVHPRDINIHLLTPKTRQTYWICWFWAIGSKCEC